MHDQVSKKARSEIQLLSSVMAFSLPVSRLLIVDAANGLTAEQHDPTPTALSVFEPAFAGA
jgi:hypothetical protein